MPRDACRPTLGLALAGSEEAPPGRRCVTRPATADPPLPPVEGLCWDKMLSFISQVAARQGLSPVDAAPAAGGTSRLPTNQASEGLPFLEQLPLDHSQQPQNAPQRAFSRSPGLSQGRRPRARVAAKSAFALAAESRMCAGAPAGGEGAPAVGETAAASPANTPQCSLPAAVGVGSRKRRRRNSFRVKSSSPTPCEPPPVVRSELLVSEGFSLDVSKAFSPFLSTAAEPPGQNALVVASTHAASGSDRGAPLLCDDSEQDQPADGEILQELEDSLCSLFESGEPQEEAPSAGAPRGVSSPRRLEGPPCKQEAGEGGTLQEGLAEKHALLPETLPQASSPELVAKEGSRSALAASRKLEKGGGCQRSLCSEALKKARDACSRLGAPTAVPAVPSEGAPKGPCASALSNSSSSSSSSERSSTCSSRSACKGCDELRQQMLRMQLHGYEEWGEKNSRLVAALDSKQQALQQQEQQMHGLQQQIEQLQVQLKQAAEEIRRRDSLLLQAKEQKQLLEEALEHAAAAEAEQQQVLQATLATPLSAIRRTHQREQHLAAQLQQGARSVSGSISGPYIPSVACGEPG
ncbi:hypothetical protein cyc_04051 [Cyclospora cayetanensis]|uniref:Uncharacterized protein n=1 Tax=Cyclospora cayetanensis TaxID=88456 RepID=A0A1D3D5X9_9EIME|nr:hypothetical protein cyc_04051 [Cyclospora cayetanensis]